MRKRPLALFVSACILLYFPIELYWRWQFQEIQLDYVDFVLSGAIPIALILGLLRVTAVSWYTLVAMVSLWGMRDLHDYYASQGASSFSFLTHIFIYALSLGYFINPRVRRVYFDPKMRWWRAKVRHETHLAMLLSSGKEYQHPILRNLSEGGCFVETAHCLKMNEFMNIAIPLPVPLGVSVLKTRGEVRWVSNNPQRQGMGVQFCDLGKTELKAIREYVKQQL